MCIALFTPINNMHKLTPYQFPSAQSCKKRKTTFTLINLYIPDSKQIHYSRTVILDMFQHLNTLRTGLLNCLNAHSQGLIQSEVRFL